MQRAREKEPWLYAKLTLLEESPQPYLELRTFFATLELHALVDRWTLFVPVICLLGAQFPLRAERLPVALQQSMLLQARRGQCDAKGAQPWPAWRELGATYWTANFSLINSHTWCSATVSWTASPMSRRYHFHLGGTRCCRGLSGKQLWAVRGPHFPHSVGVRNAARLT